MKVAVKYFENRGSGTADDPIRMVEYWTVDGKIVALDDPVWRGIIKQDDSRPSGEEPKR